ncbi:MAG: hypothetical protein AB1679_36240 [Actinomycetota bacterium]|jgi:hypothetical protein
MMRSHTGRMKLMLAAGSAVVASWVLPVGRAVAQPLLSPEAEMSTAGRLGAAPSGNENKRAFGLSAAADLVRAGGTAGVATGGGLVLGLVTGPLAGVPSVGPGLADQATKIWGALQTSIADGAVAAAEGISQGAEPLAPALNQISVPVVTTADSLASSSAAAEEHLTRFGIRTNLVSYPFGTGAQLARALM